MRQFEIKMKLNDNIDVRDIAPLIKRDGPKDAKTIKPGSTASVTGRGG